MEEWEHCSERLGYPDMVEGERAVESSLKDVLPL